MNMKQMQVLPPVAHGVLDYLTGATLLAAPKLFGFDRSRGPAKKTAQLFGAIILGQAMLTDYKLGLFKVLPLKMHLMMDYALGPLIALSPFLFGFRRSRKPASWLTHVVAGLIGTLATPMTRTEPEPMSGGRRLEDMQRAEYAHGSLDWERERMSAGAGID
jgi:hypothetical protein